MLLSEEPMHNDTDSSKTEKEPWDFDAFVAAYNAYAVDNGGWVYEPDSNTKFLSGNYMKGPCYRTIQEFAEARVGVDQFTS